MLPQEQQRGAYFYIHPPALKERKKIKKPKGVRKMGNHSKGVFTFLNLTPLSKIIREFPLLLLFELRMQLFIIKLQTTYINNPDEKMSVISTAGITDIFLLEFFSYISISYNACLLKQIWEKPCFSPGCRSPPSVFDFCALTKNQKRRKNYGL